MEKERTSVRIGKILFVRTQSGCVTEWDARFLSRKGKSNGYVHQRSKGPSLHYSGAGTFGEYLKGSLDGSWKKQLKVLAQAAEILEEKILK